MLFRCNLDTWLFCTMNLQNSLGSLSDGFLDALCKVTYTFPGVIHIQEQSNADAQTCKETPS
jgi:hypothetical protein